MYLDDAVQATAGFEGRVNWMYLDTTRTVTVGVGQSIQSARQALKYPFQRPDASLASSDEILAEYATVMEMMPGNVAKAYRRSSSLLLNNAAIDTIFRSTVVECAEELVHLFPDFDEYPDPIKVVLIDMDYNLGTTKLRRAYPLFCNAVKNHLWSVAALHCHRIGPAPERNVWTGEQFFRAIEEEERRQTA